MVELSKLNYAFLAFGLHGWSMYYIVVFPGMNVMLKMSHIANYTTFVLKTQTCTHEIFIERCKNKNLFTKTFFSSPLNKVKWSLMFSLSSVNTCLRCLSSVGIRKSKRSELQKWVVLPKTLNKSSATSYSDILIESVLCTNIYRPMWYSMVMSLEMSPPNYYKMYN